MTAICRLGNCTDSGRAPLIIVGLVGMLFAFVSNATAEASSCKTPTGVVLQVDHSNNTLKLYRGGRCQEVKDGDEVIVPIGEPVTLEVCGTNTALFTYETKKEDVELKTLEEIQAFTGALGPYLITAGQALAPTPSFSGSGAADPKLRDPESCSGLEMSYNNVNTAFAKIKISRQSIDQALRDINESLDTLAIVAVAARNFAEKLNPETDQSQDADRKEIDAAFRDGRLSAYSKLLQAYSTLGEIPGLEESSRKLRKEIGELIQKLPPCPQLSARIRDYLEVEVLPYLDGVDEVAKQVRSTAWADRDTNFDAALALESFARNLLKAAPVWKDPKPFEIEWDKGKTVTITITRKEDPVLARVNAPQKPFEATIQVLPDRVFRPSVGLALLYTEDAVFPTYGTKAVPDVETGEVSIIEKDQEDERFSYGLTLGMTWRAMDWRQSSGWAIWLPELTINPAEDKRGFQVGVGVSYKMFKIGTGVGWMKHSVLDHQNVDDVLPDEGSLKTRDAYGKPEVYFSFSVIGWPPFKQ